MNKDKTAKVIGIAFLFILCANVAYDSPSGVIDQGNEIWISARTDGKAGTGTSIDPFDGSTQEKFDSILNRLYKENRKNVNIYLGVGTFYTLGSYVYVAYDPSPGWVADDGWKILGAGMGNTVLKLAGFTYLDPKQIEVTVSDGIWTTKTENWYQTGQELRLIAGEDVTGLVLGKVYYVSEVVDAKTFKVSDALGGITISQARIGSGGKLQTIGKDAFNTVIANRPWNKQDIEIKDLTIDCNWTGFGTTLTSPFTVPAEMGTVTVNVESSAWAKINKRVYIQQADFRVIGVYEVVAIPDPQKIVLRNLRNPHLSPPRAAQADHRFLDNLPPGTNVPGGTRICPRVNISGIGVSSARCRIERVRVTNVGAPIYEGNCGINVVGIGKPGPKWPAASEIVIRDCIVDNIWGQYGWPIQIHGNDTDVPSQGYGTQALVEGNTIYGNGLHQGLGGWNYINSFWINNKVVNCAAAFFTDTPNCRNNLIKNNMFLECKGWPVVLGGGCGIWKPGVSYRQGEMVYWNDINYTCKVVHSNHQPPDEKYWSETSNPAFSPFDKYVIEGNIFEISDTGGPILFNGNVSDTVFRNNIVRLAPGQSKGANGINFANPTNRRLIVTGNIIDSRLKIKAGNSIVFGKNNIDEKGKIRPELEYN